MLEVGEINDEISDDMNEVINEEFDSDEPLTFSERKEQSNKKMELKRKLEEHLENRRLDKELSYY